MTDLEITRQCAEAMGWDHIVGQDDLYSKPRVWKTGTQAMYDYDPLHDDAQAMAMVKKFKLELTYDVRQHQWFVREYISDSGSCVLCPDLNRAICESVAEMRYNAPKQVANATKKTHGRLAQR